MHCSLQKVHFQAQRQYNHTILISGEKPSWSLSFSQGVSWPGGPDVKKQNGIWPFKFLFYIWILKTILSKNKGKELRLCGCGNVISSRDPHEVCSNCLRLERACQAVDNPRSCRLCLVFTLKSLRRWLSRQASLSGTKPCLPSVTPGVKEEKG